MMFIVLHISISILQPKLDILCVRIVPMEVAIGRQINVELAFFIVVFFQSYMEVLLAVLVWIF